MGSKGEMRGRRSYVTRDAVRAEILALLATTDPMTPREIAERLDLMNVTIRRELLTMYREVRISRIGPLGNCRYTIGEQGELPL